MVKTRGYCDVCKGYVDKVVDTRNGLEFLRGSSVRMNTACVECNTPGSINVTNGIYAELVRQDERAHAATHHHK